jgi:hypothetical protein
MKLKLKQLGYITLFICVLPLVFSGCRKGDKDPLVTLRTRKARLTGEWKLTSGSVVSVANGVRNEHTYERDSIFERSFQNGNNALVIRQHQERITIRRDGSYVLNIRTSDTGGTNQTYAIEGSWNFAFRSKQAEVKNKEVLLLTETKRVETGIGTCNCTQSDVKPEAGAQWFIESLRNDKFVVTYNNILNVNTGFSGNSGTEHVGRFTYEKN